MTTRTEDAERLARAMGWWFDDVQGWMSGTVGGREFAMSFPREDAPLHAHLAFVGELAEAAGLTLEEITNHWDDGWDCRLGTPDGTFDWICKAPDLAHAAVRAALAARGES